MNELDRLEHKYHITMSALRAIANEPNELSYEKIMLQRDYFKITAQRAIAEIYELYYDG